MLTNKRSMYATLFFLVAVAAVLRSEQPRESDKLRARVDAMREALPVDATNDDRNRVEQDVLKFLSDRAKQSHDAEELLAVADVARSVWLPVRPDRLILEAARKALGLRPTSAAANMAVAMALWQQAQSEMADERNAVLKAHPQGDAADLYDKPRIKRKEIFLEAESLAKHAIQLSPNPSWEFWSNLASIEDELDGKDEESYAANKRALTAARRVRNNSSGLIDLSEIESLRSLWPQAIHLGHVEAGEQYFEELVRLKPATASDWFLFAFNLADAKQYAAAGRAYARGGDLVEEKDKANYYTWAAEQFSLASNDDDALAVARKALKFPIADVRTKATASRTISSILDERGVYEEALRYAEDAVGADPNDHQNHFWRASALYHLQRYQDALEEEKNALRLADGRFAFEHFLLGSIYFDLRQWDLASAAFEHAANLDKTDASSTYNIGLCMMNKGYKADAVDWFRETLKRKPNHPNRDHIEKLIAKLETK